MPFSKHSIDPEYIEAMRAAFHRVCDALQLNCHADDPMTEIVVMKIVELANAGELDPERLCIAVLADLDYAPRLAQKSRPMVRVRAERRATHYAGRETAPRGSGDKSRNASGSV
jgi:hypothetical protein